jgi:hypothetical protein
VGVGVGLGTGVGLGAGVGLGVAVEVGPLLGPMLHPEIASTTANKQMCHLAAAGSLLPRRMNWMAAEQLMNLPEKNVREIEDYREPGGVARYSALIRDIGSS